MALRAVKASPLSVRTLSGRSLVSLPEHRHFRVRFAISVKRESYPTAITRSGYKIYNKRTASLVFLRCVAHLFLSLPSRAAITCFRHLPGCSPTRSAMLYRSLPLVHWFFPCRASVLLPFGDRSDVIFLSNESEVDG